MALIFYIPSMADNIQYKVLGYLVGCIFRLYSATWRYHVTFMEGATPINIRTKSPFKSCVIGSWHGDNLALIGNFRQAKKNGLALASQSKDGTIIAAALKVMGLNVARGSTSRGGMRSLVSMIRMVKKEQYYVNMTVDGPRGPRHKAKPGIHLFANKARLPLYQCLVHCDRKWEFPTTWDKSYLPKPFAHISIYVYELPQATEENRNKIIGIFNARTTPPDSETCRR